MRKRPGSADYSHEVRHTGGVTLGQSSAPLHSRENPSTPSRTVCCGRAWPRSRRQCALAAAAHAQAYSCSSPSPAPPERAWPPPRPRQADAGKFLKLICLKEGMYCSEPKSRKRHGKRHRKNRKRHRAAKEQQRERTSTYPGPSAGLQGWVPLPLHTVRCRLGQSR